MIQEQDGTILLGRIYWADESAKMPRFSPLSVELKDENGNIIIPEVLLSYMNGIEIISAK